MENTGALLVNLGSPDSPHEQDVRRYLNEFLMDSNVIDMPWLIRRMIVSLFVLPKRPAQSARAYASVWTEKGSPLINISKDLHEEVQKLTSMPVELAMRYGNPDMESALVRLASKPEIKEVLLFPLYPHFAMSTVKTVVEKAEKIIKEYELPVSLKIHPVFYDQDAYIDALVQSAKEYLEKDYDHIVFSYHGVPERHIRKDDCTGSHCLKSDDCCQKASPAHRSCYRHQVYRTTACFVEKAHIPVDKYSVAFQSKLGRDKWLEPATSSTIESLAQQGMKKVLVICPAFVADCLETLEEIGMEAKEDFIAAGGESLELIPCLNSHPAWTKLISQWLERPLQN